MFSFIICFTGFIFRSGGACCWLLAAGLKKIMLKVKSPPFGRLGG